MVQMIFVFLMARLLPYLYNIRMNMLPAFSIALRARRRNRKTAGSEALGRESLPAAVHIGLERDRPANEARVAPVGEKLLQKLPAPGGVRHGDAGAQRGLADHVVAAAQIVGAREGEQVRVVDEVQCFTMGFIL